MAMSTIAQTTTQSISSQLANESCEGAKFELSFVL